ncbi:MAG: tRNA lysidine(34) synthetase TilS [Tissierellaceae bacterium]
MKDKVVAVIKEHNLIEEEDNIVIGVSGGPDSMALLFCLLEFRKTTPFNIFIAHVNHGVRGEEARRDQLFVEKTAKDLDLPYYTIDVSMEQYGKEKGITAEEAGRELRYGFFREILKKQGGGKIAVAHNLNDQAETLLMRIMRGTGIDGLRGMFFKYQDIIRPILGIKREEIEKYIEENGIETVLDKTNLQPIYSRNKVRIELIPYMEENFKPNIINTLWRMSTIVSTDVDFLEEYTKREYNNLVNKGEGHSIIFNKEGFLNNHRSIQQRLIRNGILELRGSLQGTTEVQILKTLDLFLGETTGKEIDLSNGIVARTSYGDLIMEKQLVSSEKDYSYGLAVPSSLIIHNGYKFETKILERDFDLTFHGKGNVKYYDYDKVVGKLEVRNRKDGDRFVPFGMKGRKKLKDYFMDEKVPRELRNKIPLIVDNENILWVVGYRTSELYKVTDDTKRILSISYDLIYNS